MAASLAITGIGISSTAVDLDADAADDFIVLGDGFFHTAGVTVRSRKSGGGSTITIGKYGSTPELYTYNDSGRGVSYTGGTPQASDTGWISGIYDGTNDGGGTTVGGGYTITVPASTTKRRLRIYWGTWACRVTVSASLSDSSASAVSDTTTINTPSGGTGYVEIEYEAGSAAQTLLVNFFTNRVDSGYGNTTLQAATLKSIGATGVTCNLSVTDTADTLGATAQVRVSATLSRTDAADTLNATGQVLVSATLARTDASDTLAGTAGVVVTANANAADSSDTLSATAAVGNAPVTCDLAVTDAADTLTSAAAVLISAASAATDTSDALAASAAVTVTATLSATDAADTLDAFANTGTLSEVVCALAVTDEADMLSATMETQQRRGHGGRYARISYDDFYAPPMQARVAVVDEDDRLVSRARLSWAQRVVGARMVDGDDSLQASAQVVPWPALALIRTDMPLQREGAWRPVTSTAQRRPARAR